MEGKVESSVFFCNLTKTSLHPQLTKCSPKIITPHLLTSPLICQSCSQRMQVRISRHSRIFVNFSLTIFNRRYSALFSNKCIRVANSICKERILHMVPMKNITVKLELVIFRLLQPLTGNKCSHVQSHLKCLICTIDNPKRMQALF